MRATRPRSRSGLRLGTASLVALLAAVIPTGPARAGTASVEVSSGILRYVAAPGEANDLQIFGSGSSYTVLEAGGIPITPGAGCAAVQPYEVACAGSFTGISVDAGDMNDSVFLFSGVTLPAAIDGGSGDDVLTGAKGDDTLIGGPGSDTLYGKTGNDVLDGGSGDDLLYGGAGRDHLDGGSGADVMNGGLGANDVASYAARTNPVTVILDGLANDGEVGEGDNVQTESVIGGSGNDALTGDDGVNRLYGMGGNDTLTGGLGPDFLSGGTGDDDIESRDGVADAVHCGDGLDIVNADSLDAAASTCETVNRA